jgi:hypothetical protein
MGASIPNRTLSPRMSTMVMTMFSPIMMLWSRCRDKTSITGSFLPSPSPTGCGSTVPGPGSGNITHPGLFAAPRSGRTTMVIEPDNNPFFLFA